MTPLERALFRCSRSRALEDVVQSCLNVTLPCVGAHETAVLISSLSEGSSAMDAEIFVQCWLRAFGVALPPCPGPVVLRRPRMGADSQGAAALRLHSVPAARIIGDGSEAISAVNEASLGSRMLFLVDVSRYQRPSTIDTVLLCWAWMRAFPCVPVEVVRMMAQRFLAPGALRDELALIPKLLSRLGEEHGSSDLELSIILCNAVSTGFAGAAANHMDGCASRTLQHVRLLLSNAVDVAFAAEMRKAAIAAHQSGLDFMAASSPRVRILLAPDLTPVTMPTRMPRSLQLPRVWSHQGRRLCQLIFFQELALTLTSDSDAERHTSSYRWWVDPTVLAHDDGDHEDNG